MTSSEKKRKMDENPQQSDNTETMVTGFIHCVSPVKLSANGSRYFNMTIQRKDEYTDAVSFSASAHQQMLEMSKSKTPVTLHNIQMSPSLKKSGKFDVRYNHRSNMTPARNLDFEFQLPEHTKYRSIKEVEENLNAFQKTCVKVKIFEKGEADIQVLKSGTELHKCKLIVSDISGTIPLTIWGEEIQEIKVGDSYSITNVSVRSYDGKSLTTSPDTVLEKIDDIGKCLYTPTEEVSRNQKQLIIDSVSCAISYVCIACHKSIGSFNAAATFLKCAKCGMKQKTANIQNSMKCQILCGKERFTINDSVIKAHSILKNFTEAEKIENHLLSNPNVTVEVATNEPTVLKIINIE
ncbi:uncharacterized protein LOC134238343 [Saccostrea cucullata]|uniref:uncharacterized protein LOC134238343 n=1 Tax=Saccostrea cuccullata TaxID=36930 RepID=UPI002ED0C9CC